MSLATKDRQLRPWMSASRAAFREKILRIVSASASAIAEPARFADPSAARHDSGGIVLLLEPEAVGLDAEEVAGTIRRLYPELRLILVGHPNRTHDLPCQFGNSASSTANGESPIARAGRFWPDIRTDHVGRKIEISISSGRSAGVVGDEVC